LATVTRDDATSKCARAVPQRLRSSQAKEKLARVVTWLHFWVRFQVVARSPCTWARTMIERVVFINRFHFLPHVQINPSSPPPGFQLSFSICMCRVYVRSVEFVLYTTWTRSFVRARAHTTLLLIVAVCIYGPSVSSSSSVSQRYVYIITRGRTRW
jgi:hypothetical protein